MALIDGKIDFRTKIDSGKTAWVDSMITAENSFLVANGFPELSNEYNGVTTNNLTNVTNRYQLIYDSWANHYENTVFSAIIELFENYGEVLPDTLNASNLPVTISPVPLVTPPGLISGKGKIQ
jgi:hypothetical protein